MIALLFVFALVVDLEVSRLGVVVSPGCEVVIPLGRTTVSLDLDTADLEKGKMMMRWGDDKVAVWLVNLARSKESFSGAGCATGGGREVVSPLG